MWFVIFLFFVASIIYYERRKSRKAPAEVVEPANTSEDDFAEHEDMFDDPFIRSCRIARSEMSHGNTPNGPFPLGF